jgi:hypothetical protein
MSVWHKAEIDLETLSSLGQGSMAGFLNIEFVGIGDDRL